jgi:plasmid stabilization system protein ParE
MARAIRFSPEAIADIARMYDYIAPRGGERIAAAYIARIYQYCLDLEPFPERGTRRDDIWQGLRLVGFERHATIAFEVTPDEVRIVRFFGRGQDVEGELGE